MKINDKEKKVLETLEAISRPDGEYCVAFNYLMGETNFDRRGVRLACRSLARKGLAGFYRGLMDDDGAVAGAGYSITRAGQLYLNPCKECKVRVADMTTGECDECWNKRETKERLQELEKIGVPTGHLEIGKVSLHDLGMLKKHYEKEGIPAKLKPAEALTQINKLVEPYQRNYKI